MAVIDRHYRINDDLVLKDRNDLGWGNYHAHDHKIRDHDKRGDTVEIRANFKGGVCQRSCPVPDQAASLILRSFVSRSGLRQTSPIGDQLRIWRDHRAGLAARASV